MIAALLIITVIILLAVFAWLYLFNIYEVKVVVSPEYLLTGNNAEVTVNVIPVNSFGGKAPLRNVKAKFQIEKGEEIIRSFTINSDSNLATIKPNGKVGKIILIVESDFGLFPTRIEIPVVENISDIKNEN
ncbi:hypothetical protein MNBD_IGNAVI01-2878 [hydrothermal vent metagenome]|uniref:Uncharacterized protein n=1 Tax=hydrothermal vent metagenome TaxID=652676 RepID=A0A3B1CPA0_9ZZZZ